MAMREDWKNKNISWIKKTFGRGNWDATSLEGWVSLTGKLLGTFYCLENGNALRAAVTFPTTGILIPTHPLVRSGLLLEMR